MQTHETTISKRGEGAGCSTACSPEECGGAAVQGAEHSAGLLDCGAASLQPVPGRDTTINAEVTKA